MVVRIAYSLRAQKREPYSNGGSEPHVHLRFLRKVSISGAFEVIGGARFPRGIDDDEALPVIRGRNIAQAPRSVADLERFRYPDPLPDRAIARTGDILIQRIGNAPSCLLVSDELQGCLVGDTVLILRAKTENVDKTAVYLFLSSAQGRNALSMVASGTTIPQLTLRAVSSPLAFRSGAEGIRTPDLRRAKAAR
jgi:hypothetical protein